MQFRFTHVAVGVALAVSSLGVHAQSANANAPSAGAQRYYMPYESNFWSYAGGAIGRSDYDWDRYRMKFTTGRDDVDFATVGVAFKF